MKKILVIDDDEALRGMVGAVLLQSGYLPLEAESGEKGLAIIKSEPPDLVLSDVNMDGLDGFDLLQRVRSQPATSAIPIILMTGAPTGAEQRHGMEQGADDYLPKPFALSTLLAVVKVRLDRQESIVAQAKSNEARLLEVLAATHDLVSIAAARTGRLLYLNRAGRKMLGVGDNEDIGQLCLADFHADGPAKETHTELRSRAEGCGIWVGESAFRSRNGCIVPVSQQMLAHGSIDDEDAYLSVVARDVTETKQAEEKLRLLNRALEAAVSGIMICDKAGRILWTNAAFSRLTGYSALQATGKTPALLKSGVHDSQFYKQMWTTVLGGKAWHGELVNRRRDGTCYHEEMTITPVPDPQGEIQHFIAVKQDISERKQADQARLAMEVQLRQAQKLEAIGQLAAGIAHEINTPTQYVGDNVRFLQESFKSLEQVLKSHAELLRVAKTGSVPPELIARAEQEAAATDLAYLFEQMPAAIAETLEGVGRITRIVSAMKEFSHPGTEAKASADINRAIESTVTVARNEWKYVAEMKLDLDPELPSVPCFLGEFNQAILNLVVNAAHAISDVVQQTPGTKGAITIQTRRGGDHAEVRVSDTGTGIPEAARPRIFEPFFTTKAVGKGTGQGLAIVYGSVVKKHGGTVCFETEVGKGSTFIIRLPLARRGAEASPDPVREKVAFSSDRAEPAPPNAFASDRAPASVTA